MPGCFFPRQKQGLNGSHPNRLASETMKKVCSFCDTVMDPGSSPDEPVSHGICKTCYDRMLRENGLNVMKFLNLMDVPVFLVDHDVNIIEANSRARAFVGKPDSQIRGIICGTVLDCINACMPEGCGKTPFCPDCNIRNSVNFPECMLMRVPGTSRISIANENVPNMVGQISTCFAQAGLNIADLLNKSRGEIAYTLIDIDGVVPETVLERIRSIPGVLSARLLS